jgi:hypothetical protein
MGSSGSQHPEPNFARMALSHNQDAMQRVVQIEAEHSDHGTLQGIDSIPCVDQTKKKEFTVHATMIMRLAGYCRARLPRPTKCYASFHTHTSCTLQRTLREGGRGLGERSAAMPSLNRPCGSCSFYCFSE